MASLAIGCSDRRDDHSYNPGQPAGAQASSPEPWADALREKNGAEFDWGGSISEQHNSGQVMSEAQRRFIEASRRVYTTCGNGQCPRGVGGLLSLTEKNQVSSCTAFMVEQNVLATNSHCVPKDLKAPYSDVSHRMTFHMPYEYNIGLLYTIKASDLEDTKNFNPDFAFIRTTNIGFPKDQLMKVSRVGMPIDLFHTIWSARKTSFSSSGEIQFNIASYSCRATRIKVFPFYTAQTSPIVSFENCPIVHGDSGSPVVNREGVIVGIASAILRPENTNQGFQMAKEELEQLSRLGMASNFSCIPDLKKTLIDDSECHKDLSLKTANLMALDEHKQALARAPHGLALQLKDELKLWIQQNSKVIRWKTVQTPGYETGLLKSLYDFARVAAPVITEIDCIQPSKNWKDEYKTLGIFHKSKANLSFQVNTWAVGVGVDRHFLYYPKIEIRPHQKLNIEFNPSEVIKKGKTKMIVTKTMKLMGQSISIRVPEEHSICQ